MPIYPRTSASVGVPTASNPNVGLDPSGRQIQQLGQQAERTAATFTEVKKKRDEFKDETAATERYMAAVGDLETISEDLQQPANAEDAKAYFEKQYADKRPAWFEGLSPRAQMKLEQKLFPRQLEYRMNARRAETRALGNKYEAVGVGMKNNFVDAFARGAVTTFNKDGSVKAGADVDGKLTREYMEYAAYLDEGARLGYRTPQAVEQEKETAIATAAYFRANKLTQSDSEADLAQYRKTYEAEMASPGSTYLRNIDAGKRDTMQARAVTRTTELREKAEVLATKELTKQSNAFAGSIIRDFALPPEQRKLTGEQINQGLDHYATVLPRETVDAITKLSTEAYREGGTTNWDTYHDLKIQVLSQDKPITENMILRNVPTRLSAKHAEELLKLNETSSSESAVEKTRFFKEGKEHIRVLAGGVSLPGMEWMMKPVDRQNYSDLLFRFSAHARKVYAGGDGEKIAGLPALARKWALELKGGEGGSSGAQQPGDVPKVQQKSERTSPKPNFD